MENAPPAGPSGSSSTKWAVPPASAEVAFAFARPSPFSSSQSNSTQPLAPSQQHQPQLQSQAVESQPVQSSAETTRDPSPESSARAVAHEPLPAQTGEQQATIKRAGDKVDDFSHFFVSQGGGKRKASGFFADVPPQPAPVSTSSATTVTKVPPETTVAATTRPPVASTSRRPPAKLQNPAVAAPKAKPRTSATSHHPSGPKKKPSESVEITKVTSIVTGPAPEEEIDEARIKRRKVDVEDILAGVAGMQSKLDSKTKEVKHLMSRLDASAQQISQLQSEKNTLKGQFGAKLRATLDAVAVSKDELDSTAKSMKTALSDVHTQFGGLIASNDIQRELAELKEQLDDKYFSDEGTLWLERNEETKLAVLRSLQNELEKHRGVISHLRDQLATKAGEITEARDRITTLESLGSTHDRSVESLSTDLASAGEALRSATLAQSDLAKELRAWTDRNILLQGELDEMRRALKIAGEEVEKSAESYKDLRVKYDDAERVKEELAAQIDDKSRAERAATLELEASNARRQVEKDLMSEDFVRKTSEIARLVEDLASASKELAVLRPVPGLLSTAHLEISQVQSKLAAVTARADETANHQSGLLADLQKALESANNEAEGKTVQISRLRKDMDKVGEEKRALVQSETSLHGALRTTQDSLASLESSAKSEKQQLTTKLDEATSALSALQLVSAENDASRHREQEEAAKLFERFAELEIKIIDLTSANDVLSTTNDELSSSLSDHEASETDLKVELEKQKKALRQECEEGDARVRDAVKACAEKTERACRAQSSIEISGIKNELKKIKGLFDEKDKTLQRTLAELSKAKGRPGIEQSSSLDGDIEIDSEPAGVAAAAPAPVLPTHDKSPQANSVSPRHFNLTNDHSPLAALAPAPAPSPEAEYVAPKPGKKKAPAAPVGEAKKTTRRGRSTGRASTSAASTNVSDEIEDDDAGAASFTEKRPATKTTYAKKKK